MTNTAVHVFPASSSWHSYPSIYNMGHRAITDLLGVPVYVEEKVDGSQFSFGLHPDTDLPTVRLEDGVHYGLKVRSKGAVMHPDAPPGLFKAAVEEVKKRIALLKPGWTYRGEVLAKPHHNALTYDRTPQGHVILFDINPAHEEYLPYEEMADEARRIGFEPVPLLYTGLVNDIEQFRQFLESTSVLGGQKIEGVVVKPIGYSLFGLDKKVKMGKFVSEAFKEVHRKTWGESNPTGKDIIGIIQGRFTTAARWAKAVQHLREAEQITDSPRDIGPLIHEIVADVKKECEDEIKEMLFAWAWSHVKRGLTRGFPEWYKQQLLAKQFEPTTEVGICANCGIADGVPCEQPTSKCPREEKPAYITNRDTGDEA